MIRDLLLWIALTAASLAAFIIEPFIIFLPAVTGYYAAEWLWPNTRQSPLWQSLLRGFCALSGLGIGILLRTFIF